MKLLGAEDTTRAGAYLAGLIQGGDAVALVSVLSAGDVLVEEATRLALRLADGVYLEAAFGEGRDGHGSPGSHPAESPASRFCIGGWLACVPFLADVPLAAGPPRARQPVATRASPAARGALL